MTQTHEARRAARALAARWTAAPSVVPLCRPCRGPRIAPGGVTAGERSAVATLELTCTLCAAGGPVHVLGDDLAALAGEGLAHVTRQHPGAPADALVMHQHHAVGVGTVAQVAAWARTLRPDVPLSA